MQETEIKFWKYRWKDIYDISKTDPLYAVWMYWEIIYKRFWDDRYEKASVIEKALNYNWFDIYYQWDKKEEKFYEKFSFWKYRGEKYTYIVKRDAKYLWYSFSKNEEKPKPNIKLRNTLIKAIKDNWCILYDKNYKKKWLQYCKPCQTMHSLI